MCCDSAGGKCITSILLGISGSCRKAVKMEPPLQQRNYNGQRSASQTAVPTLKVMRLQSPSMAIFETGSSCGSLRNSLILPESFGVIHVGETFTAYIGALNTSPNLSVRGLCVSAQLQTPTNRFKLPSNLESANLDISPGKGRDFIISQPLEEIGQHILRVEVSYHAFSFNASNNIYGDSTMNEQQSLMFGQQQKTLRKFYRFNVSSPLNIKALAMRGGGDASVFVSISATNISKEGLTIYDCDFQPPFGLTAEKINDGLVSGDKVITKNIRRKAVDLYDECGILDPGSTRRYLFLVKASSQDALLRGIAVGDELGNAVFSWRKTLGETGRVGSATVFCPPSEISTGNDDGSFVVHGSGLSVDVAASAANRSTNQNATKESSGALDSLFPVSVEPIDPPTYMNLFVPQEVQLLVVNHSDKAMNLQIQMDSSKMIGLKVCGASFQNLGEVRQGGGSCVVSIKIIAFEGAGFFNCQGCSIVDVNSGREILQPSLFSVFVDQQAA